MMRILFPLHGYVRWNGGLDLVRLLVAALSRPDVSPTLELSFAIPQPSAASYWLQSLLRQARGIGAGNPKLVKNSASVRTQAVSEIIGGHHVVRCNDHASGIRFSANAVRADVVFPTMLPLGSSRVSRVGYLFDFQHRHLPALFPAHTRYNRDRRFARIASDANGLVVNSQAVAHDAERWLGTSPDRILVMPFAPYALPRSFDIAPIDAQCKYRIEGRYLMVCNHFWKHKDHATALRAFAALHADRMNADLRLVLTGDPVDHRDPQHYGRLVALAEDLGISASTHFLGLIPKLDQLALMRGCIGLVQPTLFEGGPGGGAVYEAIGLGVPVIVSDISVNTEIDCGDVRFFRAGDAVSLAEKISQLLSLAPPRLSREMLLSNGDANLTRLGQAIAAFLVRITANHHA